VLRVWWVNWQQSGQHRKSLRTRSKKHARLKALRLERDIVNGDATAERRPPLIKNVVAMFRDAKVAEGLAPTTLKEYHVCFQRLSAVAHELHACRISQITPTFMTRFRKRRVEELAK
jgi:hypothetical protein